MAGSFQTIETPKRWRAWDTSGNNNHGQIYSGRGLEFDGVADNLLLQASEIAGLNSYENGDAYSWALWIKGDDWSSANANWFLGNGGTNPQYLVFTSGQLRFRTDTQGDYFTMSNSILKNKTWYRIGIS